MGLPAKTSAVSLDELAEADFQACSCCAIRSLVTRSDEHAKLSNFAHVAFKPYSHSMIKNDAFYSTNPGFDLGFLLFSIIGKGTKS